MARATRDRRPRLRGRGRALHLAPRAEGIGIRVIRDGRIGFAYAGTLDPAAIAEVLAEARDNVAFGTPDEWAGLAEPDGVRRGRRRTCGASELAGLPTARQDRPGQGAGAAHPGRRQPGPGRRVPTTPTCWPRRAVATHHRHRAGRAARTAATCRVSTLADDGDEHPDRLRLHRGPLPGRLRPRRRPPGRRPSGPPACSAPPSRPPAKVTVVLDPFVTAQFLGIIGSHAQRRGRAQGPLAVRRTGSARTVAAPLFTLVDDPTNPLAYTASEIDGEGLATRRNVAHRRRRAAAVRAVTATAPGAAAPRRTGNAVRGGFKSTARLRLPRAVARPGHPRPRPSWSPTSTTACSSRWCRACTRA